MCVWGGGGAVVGGWVGGRGRGGEEGVGGGERARVGVWREKEPTCLLEATCV